MGRQENPFRDPDARPQWAQLTRLAGDRAAILFEELRRQISRIDGLREELHYYGAQDGWVPRYSVGSQQLFTAHIEPGRLAVTLAIDQRLRQGLAASANIGPGIKSAVETASADDGRAMVRIELPTVATIRSFAHLVVAKNRLSAVPY